MEDLPLSEQRLLNVTVPSCLWEFLADFYKHKYRSEPLFVHSWGLSATDTAGKLKNIDRD